VVVIRRARAEDIIAISLLASDLLPERYSSGVFTSLFERFADGMLVAENGSELVGFLIGIIPEEDTARVLMLGVVPEYRRKNVGTGLLDAFKSAVGSFHVKSIHLEVLTTNNTAIAFYQKNGFEIKERMPHFYVTGEDAFLMKKLLVTASSARVLSPS
jgi:[ribosomal protein S18]-alanine N-acetyltransferase